MTWRRFISKPLSLLLALALTLSMVPAAFAAEEEVPWAIDAASALNDAYGDGTFAANDAVVTKAAAKELFTDEGFLSEADADIIFGVAPEDDLTRAELCAAVSKALRLEFSADPSDYFDDCTGLTSEEAAGIARLASLGVISGRGPRTFEPGETVMNAELAVIFYRALNAAAGGTAGWFKNLKPGQYGYFEALYLMVRVEGASFDRESLDRDTAFGEGFSIDAEITRDSRVTLDEKDAIISYWKMRLLDASWPAGVDVGFKSQIDWPSLTGENNVLGAIVALVTAYRAVLIDNAPERAGIFWDVSEGDWYYDGVMYLCNNGIVIGTGEGRFAPHDSGKNAELAALTARIQGALGMGVSESDIMEEYAALQNGEGSWDTYFDGFADFEAFKTEFTSTFTHPDFVFLVEDVEQLLWAAPYCWVFRENYLAGNESTHMDPDEWATREQMAYVAYRLYEAYKHEDLDDTVNTAVLDRFSDKDDISPEYRTALAYLVSIGALSGDESGRLLPQEDIYRDQLSVFFSRILRGLDSSKMYDYKTAVSNAIGG